MPLQTKLEENPLTRRLLLTSVGASALIGALPHTALAYSVPRPAPQWKVSEWLNGDGGNIDSLKGKVIVIDFFQLWCPGCNKFSIPLMEHWEKKVYADEVGAGRLVFISIHTVFEGHNYQTTKRLKRFVKEKGMTHPVGVDLHMSGSRLPETMRLYQTRGTPEMAMVDKEGNIRFQQFGFFEPSQGRHVIDTLLGEQTSFG